MSIYFKAISHIYLRNQIHCHWKVLVKNMSVEIYPIWVPRCLVSIQAHLWYRSCTTNRYFAGKCLVGCSCSYLLQFSWSRLICRIQSYKLYVQLDQMSICAKIYQYGLASMKYFKWCCRPGSNLQVRDTLHCLHLFAIILVSLLVQSWHDGHVIHHMLLMVWQQVCLVSFTEHSPQFYKPSDIHWYLNSLTCPQCYSLPLPTL